MSRTILVTGGASGLGAAIVRRLAADAGHVVHFTYHRSARAAAELEAALGNVRAHPLDLTDATSRARFLASLEAIAPDVLVNNAIAGLSRRHVHKLGCEDLTAGFAANVAPVAELTHRAIALFRKRRAGRIVTVLTDYLVGEPPRGLAAYVAEKAYLAALARSWAVENAEFGVASNCVSPAMMATGLTADMDERLLAQLAEAMPGGKLLPVEDAAEAVAFFVTCSPAINGAQLVVNGARRLG